MASPLLVSDQTTLTANILNTDPGFSTTSWTNAHDSGTTGENRGLIVIFYEVGGNDKATGVTYNGTAMTSIVSLNGAQIGGGEIWYLANPATGSHDIVISWSANPGNNRNICAFTLKNIAQSSPVDVTGQANSASATSISKEITTTVDNDLALAWTLLNSTATSPGDDAGQTNICSFQRDASHNWLQVSYKEKTTAGAVTLGNSWTTAGSTDIFVTSLKYVAPTPTTNIKTFNGLAYASTKTVNGLAIASVKTRNGLS